MKSAAKVAALIALIVLPRVANLNTFVVFDEPLYWQWTNRFFLAMLGGDFAGTLVGRGNPSATIMVIQSLGLGVRYLLALLRGGFPAEILSGLYLDREIIVFSDLATRRLPMALLNAAVVLWLVLLVRRQFGRKVAIVSAILLALDPFLLSDSRTMRADAFMSVLMTIAAISLFIHLNEVNWRYLVISGFTAGVASANKTATLAMVPFILLTVAIFSARQARRVGWLSALKAGIMPLVSWGTILLAVFWAMWPALWVVPEEALALLIDLVVDTGVTGRQNYFMGQLYETHPLPFFYVVTTILRLSPLVLVGLIAAAFGFFSSKRITMLKRAAFGLEPAASGASPISRMTGTATALVIYALSIWLFMTLGLLKRDHYLMPIFPALDILGALGLVYVWTQVKSKIRVWRMAYGAEDNENGRALLTPYFIGRALLGALVVAQMAIVLPHHPYYYSYFNPLLLGSRWAAYATKIAWGLDLGVAARYLNSLENAEMLKVASPTVRNFTPEFKGTTIRFVREQPWIQADYLLIPVEDLQLKKIDPAYYEYTIRQGLVHEAVFGGLSLAWIYRGPGADYYVNSKLDGLGFLLGYDFDKDTVPAGGHVSLKLYWQNDGANSDQAFFVRLVDAAGYVWVEELAQPLPKYETAALTDEAIVESLVNLEVPIGTPPDTYFLRAGFRSKPLNEVLGTFQLHPDADKLWVTRPALSAFTVEATGSLVSDLSLEHQLDELVTPEVMMLGYSLRDDVLVRAEPDSNWLTLFWRARSNVDHDYVIALQLLDPQNEEVAYWLGRPVLSTYATDQWQAGEIVQDPWLLHLPPDVSPGNYALQLVLFDTGTEAEAGRVTLGDVSVVERRRQFDIPTMQNVLNKRLNDQVTLLGYDLSFEPLTGGGRLRVILYWQAQAPLESSYSVFVHLLDSSGSIVAQHDGVPVNGSVPTHNWVVDEVITDQHLVEFPSLPAGEYRLVAGLYNPTTGERLAASSGETSVLLRTLSLD